LDTQELPKFVLGQEPLNAAALALQDVITLLQSVRAATTVLAQAERQLVAAWGTMTKALVPLPNPEPPAPEGQ
jgi:hypothetical protein